MMALLRYIYGLPYTPVASKEMRPLQFHALVSMTAAKYQVHDLQEEVCEHMQCIIDSQTYRTEDFLEALRAVITDAKMQGSPVRARTSTGTRGGRRPTCCRSRAREARRLGEHRQRHPPQPAREVI